MNVSLRRLLFYRKNTRSHTNTDEEDQAIHIVFPNKVSECVYVCVCSGV